MTQAPTLQCVACDKEMVGSEWKNEETSALITVWGEDQVQTAMSRCKRNQPVHMKIVAEMSELGLGVHLGTVLD